MADKDEGNILPSKMSFKTICDFFDAVQSCRGKKKAQMISNLLEKTLKRRSSWWANLDADEQYQVFRLILPHVHIPTLTPYPKDPSVDLDLVKLNHLSQGVQWMALASILTLIGA